VKRTQSSLVFAASWVILLLGTVLASEAQSLSLNRLIFVNASDTASANCDVLKSVLAGIGDASADSAYTVHLEPGSYSCGSTPVQMKAFVDIEGSGRLTTIISGNGTEVVAGADNSELRSVTIMNIGGVSSASGIKVTGVRMRITDVAAFSTGGDPTTAIHVESGGHATISRSTLMAASNANDVVGLRLGDATASIDDVSVTADGSGEYTCALFVGNGALVGRDSVIEVSGSGSEAFDAISTVFGTIKLAHTQVVGPTSEGDITCFGAYNGAWTALEATCTTP
jgi:hypothetical protein